MHDHAKKPCRLKGHDLRELSVAQGRKDPLHEWLQPKKQKGRRNDHSGPHAGAESGSRANVAATGNQFNALVSEHDEAHEETPGHADLQQETARRAGLLADAMGHQHLQDGPERTSGQQNDGVDYDCSVHVPGLGADVHASLRGFPNLASGQLCDGIGSSAYMLDGCAIWNQASFVAAVSFRILLIQLMCQCRLGCDAPGVVRQTDPDSVI